MLGQIFLDPAIVDTKEFISSGSHVNVVRFGVKKLRRMAEDNEGRFAITMGSRYLIVREKFEEYIDSLINGESEVEPDEQTDS